MKRLTFLFSIIYSSSFSQPDYPLNTNLGVIASASEIKGDVIVANSGTTKLFLLRADADPGLKVFASKKTLEPNDTCLLLISFVPEKKGAFSKKISLVTSFRDAPYLLQISGTLEKLVQNGTTDCYTFGHGKIFPPNNNNEPIGVVQTNAEREQSKKLSVLTSEPSSPKKDTTGVPKNKSDIKKVESLVHPLLKNDKEVLPIAAFKPNNIVFLVDISGSMKDSLKLPLMKIALHRLIDEIREVDKITFITYADTVKILVEGANAGGRERLHFTINNLKARGMTKGKKAILIGQQVAQRNFIDEGNNQIIIATDGKFTFEKEDQRMWNERQGDKTIVLSTVAFGNDKEALRHLKDLSKKGKGSFIRITGKSESEEKILGEIKKRSARNLKE
ncbi:MAG: VWA domain-containing protein [bacterium]|nr:VWA domain-containing protein [bacterium]